MIISDRKKFILVNIYKTGADTTNQVFKKIQDFPAGFKLPDKHLTAKQIQYCWPQKWKEYTTATIVRNPWDWQVSQYTFMAEHPENDFWSIVSRFPTFTKFIKWRCSYKDKGYGYHTQTDFVINEQGGIIVDHILKIESLLKSINFLLKKLSMPQIMVLPKLNCSKTRNKDFRTYYTKETEELVADTFAIDIKNFNYTF